MTKDISPAEPDKRASAAAALVRLSREYELVRHTTGDMWALRGDDDPITLGQLVGRLARAYTEETNKVASQDARKLVLEQLDDPDVRERDLSKRLEPMLERQREKFEARRAALEAEQEAARTAELEETRAEAGALLEADNLIAEFGETVDDIIVGKDTIRAGRLLYLLLTSRLLDERRVGSELLKGQSAVGKTFLAENVLDFLPLSSVTKANSMSPKALFYRGYQQGEGECVVDLSHSVLYLGEAASSTEVEFTLSILRQLLSDGEVVHDTVIDGAYMKLIVRGPVSALITTTRAKLDHELETRFVSDRLDESEAATRAVMKQIARVEAGLVEKPDVSPWRALQRYLELTGPHQVVNPIVGALAKKLPARAIRMRRDLTVLSLLMRASALLHSVTRPRDEGRIVATVADYEIVREVILDAFDYAIGQGIPENVRLAVEKLPAKGEAGISYRALGDRLGVNHETARARAWEAIAGGYAVNLSTNRQRAELTQADPLPPESEPALPTGKKLVELLDEVDVGDMDGGAGVEVDPPLRHAAANPYEQAENGGARPSATDSPLRHEHENMTDGVADVADGGESPIRHEISHNDAGFPVSGGVADVNGGPPRGGGVDPDVEALLAAHDREERST
jgi:hypothetical protein